METVFLIDGETTAGTATDGNMDGHLYSRHDIVEQDSQPRLDSPRRWNIYES